MRIAVKPSFGFRDFAEEAGIGSLTWSRSSYLAAKYYRLIVALFTSVLLLLVLYFQLDARSLALVYLGLYWLYFLVRHLLSPQAERRFYRPNMQFLRAELGLIAITLIILSAPGAEHTALWLLYGLVILLASKHNSTERMLFIAFESGLALVLIRLWRGVPIQEVARDFDLWADWLGIGLLAFILHYLVRNIQARDETIAAYDAVNALARNVDMTEATGADQWRPMLTALVTQLGGKCASTWMIEPKTHQLQLIASVQRREHNPAMFCLIDNAVGVAIPMGQPSLIAAVASTGQADHFVAKPFADTDSAPAPNCHAQCAQVDAELAMPINVGTSDRQSTIGVLSVGFDASSFHKRLVPEYQSFMSGLLSQAKPMLAYAQRLGELVSLQQASRQVWRSLDLEQVLGSILQAVVNAFGFEFATISLVDDDGCLIRSVKGIHVPQEWLDMAVHRLDSTDIQADIIRSGETEVIVGCDDRFDKRIWSTFGHEFMVRVFTPIEVIDAVTHRARRIGTIEAGYRRPDRSAIGPDQLRMLELFRDQVAMAIEHARLLQRVQKKAEILTSLHCVGNAIASARESAHVLEEIGRSAQSLLKADIVMLYRYDRQRHAVEQPLIFGDFGDEYRLNLTLNHENILTRMLNEIEPYYSADADLDPLLASHLADGDGASGWAKRTFTQRHNIKSVAGIPLIAHGDRVGIMFVNYRRRHQFDEDERQVHELFAQQAAVAIKNAESNELERELIVRRERTNLSHELHHSVSQALFGIALQAQNAMRELEPGQQAIHTDFANILETAHIASNETGFIIDELRAPIDESRHLIRGLEEYTRRIRKWYGLKVHLEHALHSELPPAIEQPALRFAREAINNAVRHSDCHTIDVLCESDESRIQLLIRDDGVGFDLARVPPRKLGLMSMSEIAGSLNGKLEIDTAPGAGTSVRLTLPCQQEVATDE